MDQEGRDELLEEIRLDVKDILQRLPHFVTWEKLAAAVVTVAGLTLAAIKLFSSNTAARTAT